MPQDTGFGSRMRRPTPVVGATLAVLLAVFVASTLAVRFVPGAGDLYQALMLVPAATLHGARLWTVLTMALLHSLDDPFHLIFNGLVLYFFGPDLEERWGRGRFVLFMVLCALGGSAFVLCASALGLTPESYSVVGFSGVTMGVTTAWGLTYPDRQMYFFFFPLRGLHLVYLTLALQVLSALSFSNVSAACHFGGMAAGALYASTQGGPLRRWWLQRRLGRLQAQAGALRGTAAARRAAGPALRVIKGGGGDAPKDKRTLN
jgi:membrane associated rhomboid family serine protease